MPRDVKNILFIMCDQLRFDYLSCYGHPHLETTNMDRLAARGVRFDRAYVQSPVCGSSRMSFYTGRYVHSHGATWNGVPLKVGEMTLGDHLRPLGLRTALVGKTHMRPDVEGMARLGLDPGSIIGTYVAECGFEPYDRLDGLHSSGPDGPYDPVAPRYNAWLKEQGYDGDNPWDEWANAAAGDDGEPLSGWFMRHAGKPARIADAHSETAYATDRAMDFISEAGDQPWCLHLSYIKPHWPYIVSAPYHDMYGPEHVLPVVRSEAERRDPHPVYAAFMEHKVGQTFSRQGVRETVIPAYMGLIKQIDDHLGRLFDFLEARGRFEDTMIVFTSDHGDYLGDHWLGEKDLFHEPSVRVPLIVYDPSPAADGERGSASGELVEAIDLAATFVDVMGGDHSAPRLEGLSLLPLLRQGKADDWRRYAISEYDYSMLPAGPALGREPSNALLYMIADKRWKYIEAPGFRPMLFDLRSDPEEFHDLGADPAHEDRRRSMAEALTRWALRQSQRTSRSDAGILASRGTSLRKGVLIGFWDEDELPADLRPS